MLMLKHDHAFNSIQMLHELALLPMVFDLEKYKDIGLDENIVNRGVEYSYRLFSQF